MEKFLYGRPFFFGHTSDFTAFSRSETVIFLVAKIGWLSSRGMIILLPIKREYKTQFPTAFLVLMKIVFLMLQFLQHILELSDPENSKNT